jgi:hypothetical protein
MITINLNLVTFVAESDRQLDIFYGASVVKVTGNNHSMARLLATITEHDGSVTWLRLDDPDLTSRNVYPLGSEEPHYT